MQENGCGVPLMSSIILGMLASVLPNLLQYRLYTIIKDKVPNRFIKFFYLSEGVKFAALALLVSAFLQWPNLHIVKFFTAFLLSEMARLLFQFFKLKRTAIK